MKVLDLTPSKWEPTLKVYACEDTAHEGDFDGHFVIEIGASSRMLEPDEARLLVQTMQEYLWVEVE